MGLKNALQIAFVITQTTYSTNTDLTSSKVRFDTNDCEPIPPNNHTNSIDQPGLGI